jgi:hypothetical protein
MSEPHFLLGLAFSSATLAAVHLGTFTWLTAFVYHANIRGYVPAGITGMSFVFLAWVLLQIPLVMAGRRRRHTTQYLLGGVVGVPVAIVLASFYSSALIALFGYTLEKDIAISSFGAVLSAAIAVYGHRCYLSSKSDNKALHATAAAPGN